MFPIMHPKTGIKLNDKKIPKNNTDNLNIKFDNNTNRYKIYCDI